MTRADITIGRLVRTVVDRGDVPAGSIGTIERIGTSGERWCFGVKWLSATARKGGPYSLNQFEENLPDFEVIAADTLSRESHAEAEAAARKRPADPDQARLPFGSDGG